MIYLNNIKFYDIAESPEAQTLLRVCIDTLFKVINNVIQFPSEPKYRKLPKKKEGIRTKILAYPNAVEFLKIAGFSFQAEDYIELE